MTEEVKRLRKEYEAIEDNNHLLRLRIKNLEHRAIEAADEAEYEVVVNKLIPLRKELKEAVNSECVARYKLGAAECAERFARSTEQEKINADY